MALEQLRVFTFYLMLREFAGVFIMHKKRHFVIIGLIAILFIIQAIFAVLGWGKYIIA